MFLKNHIAYRFLTDDDFAMEMVEAQYPKEFKELAFKGKEPKEESLAKVCQLYELANYHDQKAFLVTSTVLDKLDILKVKRRENGQFDWSVFSHLKDLKYTFILPPMNGSKGGICLRVKKGGRNVNPGFLEFIYLAFDFDKGSQLQGEARWEHLYVNLNKNHQCEHFDSPKCRKLNLDELIYKLLCFIFLSDNEEEIIQPGQKKGTRRSGKIINFLPFPLTVVTSKWNITSIRTEGFLVSPHLAIRWTGTGRQIPRMVLINQFEKKGYIRRAHT